MASSHIIKTTGALRQVKPLLSVDEAEARRRVLKLYKSWYRQIPLIVKDFSVPKSVPQCREKLREEFVKKRNVKDIRVIDMLVIKSQIELKGFVEYWNQSHHLMAYWNEAVEPKPTDFLSKFLDGHD